MPFIDVTLGTGRSPEQIRRLIHELTYAVHRAVGAPVTAVRVCIREVRPDHWSAGDVTTAERQAAGPGQPAGSPDQPATGPDRPAGQTNSDDPAGPPARAQGKD